MNSANLIRLVSERLDFWDATTHTHTQHVQNGLSDGVMGVPYRLSLAASTDVTSVQVEQMGETSPPAASKGHSSDILGGADRRVPL